MKLTDLVFLVPTFGSPTAILVVRGTGPLCAEDLLLVPVFGFAVLAFCIWWVEIRGSR